MDTDVTISLLHHVNKGRNKTATALENASPDLRARIAELEKDRDQIAKMVLGAEATDYSHTALVAGIREVHDRRDYWRHKWGTENLTLKDQIAELESQLAREIEARNGWWDHCNVAEQRNAELVAALRNSRDALNYAIGAMSEGDPLKRKVEVTRDSASSVLAHAESATPVILDEAAVTAAYVRSKTPTATPAMWVGAPYDCPHCGQRHNPGPCYGLHVTQAADTGCAAPAPTQLAQRDDPRYKGTDYKSTPAKHPDTEDSK